MKYNITIILSLSTLFPLHVLAYFNSIFSENTTIAHPETGLFLSYVGLYTPSEEIVHNSAIFPMATATCHFLPLSAAQNIAACNITTKRQKRLITDFISFGMGAINLGMSAANSMQISNLQQQGAQLAKIHSNQIELADELQVTRQALNAMVPILSSHSEAINTLKT
ncbi:unnamed protein product, partial [Adineta steineri]